jgi:Calcineurin-like phosphoesterase
MQSNEDSMISFPRRTIIVGDIQGCYDELNDLLAKVGLTDKDRVIAVGDLIVKGPKNKQVLDRFISDDRFSSVLGNQDLAVLQRLQGLEGKFTKAQKRAARELGSDPQKYIAYLSSLPLMIDLRTQLIVHAGLRAGIPLEQQDPADLLELRTLGKKRTKRTGTPWYEVYEGPKFVFFGHWPAPQPRRGLHALGLDTGCVYGYRLTACIAETGEILSVPSCDSYARAGRRFEKSSVPEVQSFNSRLSFV